MKELLKMVLVQILTWEARMVLLRHAPHIIAVTGSVGKTTTKDAIFAALSPHLYVRKSEKSFNSEIGVPLTILGLGNAWNNPIGWLINIVRGAWIALAGRRYPQWLVVEVGVDRPGDIRRLARWLKPSVVVFTGVPETPVHVEFFKSVEELAREKGFLVEALREGGVLIANGDDEHARAVHRAFEGTSFAYGRSEECTFRAMNEEILYEENMPIGIQFRVEHNGSSMPVSILGALGSPKVYAALAALAVAECIGLDSVSAAVSLSAWQPTPGRMRLIKGLKGSILIDDTYNSSPAAAFAALDTLKEIKGIRRRIAVLGDMLELGKFSSDAHRKVGAYAAKRASMLLTVGFRARGIAEGARDAGMKEEKIRVYELNELERAGKELKAELRKGDVILVKGSQSMRMERLVEELMAEPEQAKNLLVRQDDEWKAR